MRRQKTHEEYVTELSKVNPDIEVIGIYMGNKVKIPHRCKIDGTIWDVAPSNTLQGRGCPTCKATKLSKEKFITHSEYVKKLAEINPYIEVIGSYCGSKTKISHRCKVDGYIWDISPGNALAGKGCPVCRNRKVANTLKKSKEEYIKELKIKNPYIEIVGEYHNANSKTMHHCLLHDIYWEITPNRALNGNGCEECKWEKFSKTKTKTHEQYVDEVKIVNPNIEVIGQYTNAKIPIEHRCITHNIFWNAYPFAILRGGGCYKCGSEKITNRFKKTHEQYVRDLKNINSKIEVLEEYIDSLTPILHKCLIDNYEWMARPANILHGTGCPKCSESKGEKSIRIWLEKNNIDYIHQHKYEDCKDIYPLPFDFYLPKYNTLIEYDGEQHFRPIEHFGGQEYFEYIQKHDAIKNEYCKNNGISLLRIPYYKYNNIEEELNNFLFI